MTARANDKKISPGPSFSKRGEQKEQRSLDAIFRKKSWMHSPFDKGGDRGGFDFF
jgi:hypothetical protein